MHLKLHDRTEKKDLKSRKSHCKQDHVIDETSHWHSKAFINYSQVVDVHGASVLGETLRRVDVKDILLSES